MTDFLYPFIDGGEDDLEALISDLARSVQDKAAGSASLCTATLERLRPSLATAADAMARRFAGGGRLYTFGNGRSSTDAAALAALFSTPPRARPLPARNLAEDSAVITALGNDIGFSNIFSRQIIAHGRAGDIAVGFSTSGNSEDLLTAFAEAASRGMLAVGFAGYDGGDMGRAALDHCLVVDSDSVHRIQEAQAAVSFALWQGVQASLDRAIVDA